MLYYIHKEYKYIWERIVVCILSMVKEKRAPNNQCSLSCGH